MPKKDFFQIAFDVALRATREAAEEAVQPPQNEGRRKGGVAGRAKRAIKLSAEQRREIAIKAAAARWKKTPNPSEAS